MCTWQDRCTSSGACSALMAPMQPMRLSWTPWPASRVPCMRVQVEQTRGETFHRTGPWRERSASDGPAASGNHLLMANLVCNGCVHAMRCLRAVHRKAEMCLTFVQGVQSQWTGPRILRRCRGGDSSCLLCEIKQYTAALAHHEHHCVICTTSVQDSPCPCHLYKNIYAYIMWLQKSFIHFSPLYTFEDTILLFQRRSCGTEACAKDPSLPMTPATWVGFSLVVSTRCKKRAIYLWNQCAITKGWWAGHEDAVMAGRRSRNRVLQHISWPSKIAWASQIL